MGEGVWEHLTERWSLPSRTGFPSLENRSGQALGWGPTSATSLGHAAVTLGGRPTAPPPPIGQARLGPSAQTLNFKQNQSLFRVWAKNLVLFFFFSKSLGLASPKLYCAKRSVLL